MTDGFEAGLADADRAMVRGLSTDVESTASPCGGSRSLDRLHSERVRDLPGFVLHPEETGDKAVIEAVRDRGELGPMIAGAATR